MDLIEFYSYKMYKNIIKKVLFLLSLYIEYVMFKWILLFFCDVYVIGVIKVSINKLVVKLYCVMDYICYCCVER